METNKQGKKPDTGMQQGNGPQRDVRGDDPGGQFRQEGGSSVGYGGQGQSTAPGFGQKGQEPRMEQSSGRSSGGSQAADQAKRDVKEKVAKGVAAVAGALEGFVDEAKKNDLPETAREAVKKAGETTRKAAEATRKETEKIKESVKGGQQSSGKAHVEPVLGREKSNLGRDTSYERSLRSSKGRL